jgi:von Willebrand factor type A domain
MTSSSKFVHLGTPLSPRRRSWAPLLILLGPLFLVGAFARPITEAISDARFDGDVVHRTDVLKRTVVLKAPEIPGRLDVMFVLDMSSSYEDDLPKMKVQIPQALARLASASDLQVGLVTFIDDPTSGGSPNDYPYRKEVSLAADVSLVTGALNGLSTSGGGEDIPESWSYAIAKLLTETTFRPDAKKVIILATDAPTKTRLSTPLASKGPTIDDLAAKLQAQGIVVIVAVPSAGDTDQASELAAKTGGVSRTVSGDSSDLAAAISAGLGSLKVNLEPRFVAGSCPITVRSVSPSVIPNLDANEEAAVTFTYQVQKDAPPGDYECRFASPPDPGKTMKAMRVRV